MGDFIEPVQLQRIGWMLLHSLWQIALLWLLHLLCQFLLLKARSQTRYLVSVLFLFAIPAVACSTLLVGPPKIAALAALADSSPPLKLNQWGLYAVPKTTANWYVDAALYVRPLIPWLATVWIVVLGLRAIMMVSGWALLQHTVRSGAQLRFEEVIVSPDITRLLRRVRVVETSRLIMPAATGLIRPCILFPVGMATGLTPQQLECVLAHELAHIRRWDYLVLLLQSVLESVFWFHPCVWMLSRKVTALREDCADDDAVRMVGNAKQYGETLLAVGEMQTTIAMTLGLAGSSLTARIRRLVVQRFSTPAAARGRMLGLLISTSLVLLCVGSAIAYSDRAARDRMLLSETSFEDAIYHMIDAPRGRGHLLPAIEQVMLATNRSETVQPEALVPIVDAIDAGTEPDEIMMGSLDLVGLRTMPVVPSDQWRYGSSRLRHAYARTIYGYARDSTYPSIRRRWGRAAIILAAQQSVLGATRLIDILKQPDLADVCGFDDGLHRRLLELMGPGIRPRTPTMELIEFEKATPARVREWVEMARHSPHELKTVAAVTAQYKDDRKQAGVDALRKRHDVYGDLLADLILHGPTPPPPAGTYESIGSPKVKATPPEPIPSRRSPPP